MKTSELIKMLKGAMAENGDQDIVGIAMGKIYPYVDINCPDDESPLYIELSSDEEV